MKTKTTYYKLGQSLPPRHWYQKRVGWFGKGMVAILALTVIGGGAYGKFMLHEDSKVRASQSSRLEKLRKETPALNSTNENIIDIQLVLDRWTKERSGETWSVSARSLDGPKFQAQVNADEAYESVTAGQLLMTLPLFSQIPAEQHKGIQLTSGKKMETCVNLMIRLGDTDCGSQIASYIDFRKVDALLQKHGIKKTILTGSKARTTADDMAAFMAAVQGGALQKNAQDVVLKSLREQRIRSGIPAACPGCVVANEASESVGVHDVAIIQYNGGSYVLSVFTNDGSLGDIAELSGRIQQKIIDTVSD